MAATSEKAQRDEFARDLFLADNSSFPPGLAEKDWDESREHHDYAFAIADGLIAKGYRKPRTITTTEELDALEHGSVIRSEQRHYWVAHKEDGEGGNQGWAAAGTSRIPANLGDWLPAVVLYEPQETGKKIMQELCE